MNILLFFPGLLALAVGWLLLGTADRHRKCIKALMDLSKEEDGRKYDFVPRQLDVLGAREQIFGVVGASLLYVGILFMMAIALLGR